MKIMGTHKIPGYIVKLMRDTENGVPVMPENPKSKGDKYDFPNFPVSKPSPEEIMKREDLVKNNPLMGIISILIMLGICIYLPFSNPELTNIQLLTTFWYYYLVQIIAIVFIVKDRNG